jgi:hypothetical protein
MSQPHRGSDTRPITRASHGLDAAKGPSDAHYMMARSHDAPLTRRRIDDCNRMLMNATRNVGENDDALDKDYKLLTG